MLSLSVSSLPRLNACLNTASAVFLVAGYSFIRKRKILLHKTCMLSAVCCSAIFLTSYIYFHLHAGIIYFQGHGWVRPVYFTILTTHTILAVAILPLVVTTLYFALRGRFESHRTIARWTFPIWLYVSVTGVVIYWLLYIVYVAPASASSVHALLGAMAHI
ncbi:MAG TPA: DUF420 domain-containing protein [Candidatus Limnocylindrales bacterium]|nr:DUF420 domain-containing protein [Candidatus Limnocylindrales bacterium]